MIHQVKISGGVLIVGATDILAAFQFTADASQPNAIAASAPKLYDLVASVDEVIAKHEVVLFETDVSEADIIALEYFVAAAQGRTKFIALVDENLPLSKVRKLENSGAADVLPLEIQADVLVQAIAEIAKSPKTPELKKVQAGSKAKVFSIAQSRGGAGATTVAVNLAASLARSTKRGQPAPRVLLLDLDLQFGNAGTYLDLEDNGALYDLITQESLPSEPAILDAVQSSGHGVDVLTAPVVFLPLTSMSPEFVAHLIDVFRDAYDYVVIDLPRATLDWLTPAILATDRLIMVSDGSVPCIRQAKRLIDVYRESRLTLPVELVMNREKKQFFGSETIRDAEALLGLKVVAWVPDNPGGERRAIDLGRPSALVRSKGRKTYRQLAKSLSFTVNSSSDAIV
ncbi:MAG: pilus assembly protein CpaE [Reinekea sp.]|jgi:pilus assembly protein CpaE